MKVNINKDMTRFKREKGNGMNRDDLLKIIISIVICVVLMSALYFFLHIPVFLSMLLTLIPVIPLCLLMFFRTQEGGFVKYIKSEMEYLKGDKKLVYRSISYQEFSNMFNITGSNEEDNTNKGEKKKESKLKKALLPDTSFAKRN